MKEINITAKDAGQRLDKYLKKYMPAAGSAFLYKMLRKKNITLNGRKAEGKEILAEKDCIRIFFSEETFAKMRGQNREGAAAEAKSGRGREAYRSLKEIIVVYEDEDLLFANKPAGILSQSAATGEQMSAYEGLRVGQTIASRELGVTKAYLTADASRLGKLAGGAGNLAGMAAGSLFERFNGRRGPGGPGIGGPGGGSGDENPGKFENKSRPQAGALPVVAGIGGGRMSASKATGSAVKGALPAGGAAKQGGGFAGAPGKGAGAGASQSMQDILSGNNAGGIGSGWEILNDDGSNANNGAFNGAAHENMQDGNNAGASQSMQDILSGNNAGEIGAGGEILHDDGSNANNGAFDSSEWVNVENVNNAGPAQSMQDIVSGSNNIGQPAGGAAGGNNNGAFDSSGWVNVENVNNAGPAQSMQDIVSGSNNIGQPAGGVAGGNNNGAFDSSGWVNVENINDVGASRSMQDIISGNDSLGDMSGGSFDASLNNVGSLNDEDDE